MAKLTISMGTPPLGIGGDTYKSAFNKCNLNFTELYQSMQYVSTHSSIRRYKDLVGIYQSAATVTGALVLHLPVKALNCTTMSTFKIRGYNYAVNQGGWELIVGGYNYTGKAWHSYSAAVVGNPPFTEVRLGHAADHQVIILGGIATKWQYPSVELYEMIATYANLDKWDTGYRLAFETDISAYTGLVSPSLMGSTRAGTADKLTTARTIGGVSFDGSANINLPGVNTAGNQSTTGKILTEGGPAKTVASLVTTNSNTNSWNNTANTVGKLTNSNNCLAFLVGGTTNERVAALQSGHASEVYASSTGTLALNPLGGVVTANGSKVLTESGGANKLSAARTFTFGGSVDGSVSFNGSANVTVNLAPRRANATTTLETDFRAQTKGDTAAGNYLAVVRSETAVSNLASAYSAGLAIGTSDTHGFISFSYNTPQVFVGAGSGAKLNWKKQLAFTDGNVASATKLATARNLTIGRTAKSFDGSANVAWTADEVLPTGTNGQVLKHNGTSWVAGTDSNTVYGLMPVAEMQAGTAITSRLLSAQGLKAAILYHAPLGGQFIGTQATKAIAYNAQNISENVTIPGNVNALSAGPITIDSGKTVTISSGATWTIV